MTDKCREAFERWAEKQKLCLRKHKEGYLSDVTDDAYFVWQAAHADQQWQPIETAPKDGAWIFIWNGQWPHPVKAQWRENDGEDGVFYGWSFDEFINMGGCEDGFLGWQEDIDDGNMPTHWMPLPKLMEQANE